MFFFSCTGEDTKLRQRSSVLPVPPPSHTAGMLFWTASVRLQKRRLAAAVCKSEGWRVCVCRVGWWWGVSVEEKTKKVGGGGAWATKAQEKKSIL